MKFTASPKYLIVVFVAMFLIIFASSKWLPGKRLDLTENSLYTLSEGTEKILGKLDQTVTLDLYFSEKATSQIPALRAYAQRVEELLEEYVGLADGKIIFSRVDPEPFSEAEDEAALAGLQGVAAGGRGDKIYFGLVARSESGASEVIAFLQPDRETFLEYELTRLISSLSSTSLPKVGIVSGLEINGGMDYMTRQPRPVWSILQFIEEGFDIEWLDNTASKIEGIDLLLLIAPQQLPDSFLFAIDQFVLSGGRALIFLDPYMEASPNLAATRAVQRSDLAQLLPSWGLKLREEMVLTDYANSLVVGVGSTRNPVRHIGLLGMTPDTLDSDDIVLHGLESLNWSSAGILDPQEMEGIQITELVRSSDQSEPRPAELLLTLQDPSSLLKEFAPTGERYLLAARVSGSAKSAFPEGIDVEIEAEETEDGTSETSEPKNVETQHLDPALLESDNIQVMVVSDTDILSDRLWVQVQNFFGQQIVTPWADNGSFLVNALDNLSGNPDLIEIRSQGRFTRPFKRVEDLRKEAEESFLSQQGLLEEELEATESKLVELERQRGTDDGALFTPEQELELEKFQEEKLKIRKQLREVQHQLSQDIEALGTRLKLINIFLIPFLICLLVFLGAVRKRFV